ncbi:hypothetical protein BHP08_002141 [Escherichia coli]|nr:hypothetical protein [Escherichia coli]HDQ6655396.1 hypothetical protein [Escherichia coli O22:H16]HDQ6798681.1 hypothetical protein [Escherichia coli O128AB:H2]HDQ6860461.1 hypothetical protein [Escherichia coli O128AC:H2]HDQ6879746.1 hypothetical protein [Escherichia coli O174:H8]HDQ6907474.1 hypothetical protein [Escherichia coli O146:H21]
MPNIILSDISASVSELKIAALKNNTGTFYLSSLDIDNYCTNKGSQHQPTDQTPLLIQ